jgi:hypothetical protein
MVVGRGISRRTFLRLAGTAGAGALVGVLDLDLIALQGVEGIDNPLFSTRIGTGSRSIATSTGTTTASP